ncbi:MAG TPA: hypothetical protein VF013_01400 [Candidatus Limnocylindria bacterium]
MGMGRRTLLALALALPMLAGCDLILPPVPTPTPTTPPAPLGGPPVQCEGVPASACAMFRDSWREDPRIDPHLVDSVVVRCVVVRCDEADGEVRVFVILPDGRRLETTGGAYAEAPAPATEPT